jgi:hypothetical protein
MAPSFGHFDFLAQFLLNRHNFKLTMTSTISQHSPYFGRNRAVWRKEKVLFFTPANRCRVGVSKNAHPQRDRSPLRAHPSRIQRLDTHQYPQNYVAHPPFHPTASNLGN